MSDYLEAAILTTILQGNRWLGLAVGTPFVDSSVAPYTNEQSGQGYARFALVNGFTIATVAGVTTGKNTNPIEFPIATGDYGSQVVGWGLFNAATGGNLYIHGTCTARTIVTGNVPWFDAEALVVEAK